MSNFNSNFKVKINLFDTSLFVEFNILFSVIPHKDKIIVTSTTYVMIKEKIINNLIYFHLLYNLI